MILKVNSFNDGETQRQQRNLTNSQKRANTYTKEGVLVNTYVKGAEAENIDMHDTYDNLLISQNTKLPPELKQNKNAGLSLMPICAIAAGVMASVAGITALIRHSSKINLNIDELKKLPTTTRNVTLNDETHQALYQIIQSPNQKTILAGMGVLTLTALAFTGKMFFDGFKDVWVKRQEAEIQKNLQENLIAVETQSFSGKIQIIRSMLSDYAKEFDEFFAKDGEKDLPNFGQSILGGISFTSEQPESDKKKSVAQYILAGIATAGAMIGFGFFAMKNLSKSKKHLDDYAKITENVIKNIVSTSNEKSKTVDKETLTKLFNSIEATPEKIRASIQDLKWTKQEKEDFVNEVIREIHTSTTKVDNAIGGNGTPKPAFVSFVNDYRAFFYNWLLDTSNPQFKALFFGITGLTVAGYGGKLLGDAVREVQVKKYNAETELNLQRRLVSTELRNFKSKKDSAIKPLVEEFYNQAQNGKSKSELKVMADNILFEVKNGPPFVYS